MDYWALSSSVITDYLSPVWGGGEGGDGGIGDGGGGGDGGGCVTVSDCWARLWGAVVPTTTTTTITTRHRHQPRVKLRDHRYTTVTTAITTQTDIIVQSQLSTTSTPDF